MTPVTRRTVFAWSALALGLVIFVVTLAYIDLRVAIDTTARLGVALPIALLFSGLWHLARTWAWAWCFPQPRAVGFAELARVRLAAEAFSYLTLRGIAGEPLKVVFLSHKVDARQATAAVALERIAYLVGTTVIVGIASIAAIALLPLTRPWFRVFRAFAIMAAVVTVLTGFVISGRGNYLHALLRRVDRMTGRGMADGRAGRFIAAVEHEMLELVRGNRRRLIVLAVATLAAYACMAFEAWIILRGTGVAVSINGSFAIETFSRVASFASAFIPANLGALEASSLAATAAIGVASGGVALAVARRIRGLFWAAIGLAMFPRNRRDTSGRHEASSTSGVGPRGPALLYTLDAFDLPAMSRLAGLPIAERVMRAASRAGYARIFAFVPASHPSADALRRLCARTGTTAISSDEDWRTTFDTFHDDAAITVVDAGTVVSTALLTQAKSLVPPELEAVDVPAGATWRESGVLRIRAADARDPQFVLREVAARRGRLPALPSGEDAAEGRALLALRVRTPDDLPAAEREIRRSAYKDTDATLARFNRRMSLPISVALIRTPITANQLSVILVAIGFYSAWLFSLGHYWTGVLGAFLSLAASVLDGCDGEIARLKYQESTLGCWMETIGDYSYYLAIFVGLTVGAVRQTGWEGFSWIGLVALAGTLISFALLIYLRGRITAGRPEKLHAVARERFTADTSLWARVIWRVSFVATRSAMPYGIMAFALLNALPGIVVLAAAGANIYWICLVLKLRDLLSGEETVTA